MTTESLLSRKFPSTPTPTPISIALLSLARQIFEPALYNLDALFELVFATLDKFF